MRIIIIVILYFTYDTRARLYAQECKYAMHCYYRTVCKKVVIDSKSTREIYGQQEKWTRLRKTTRHDHKLEIVYQLTKEYLVLKEGIILNCKIRNYRLQYSIIKTGVTYAAECLSVQSICNLFSKELPDEIFFINRQEIMTKA